MKTFRVAVVGCGHWGRNHVRVWSELGALAAVCDVDEARLEAVLASYPGIKGVTRFEDLLAMDTIDAVIIATPSVTHVELTRKALKAGKDVLVEKPMALTVPDARELVSLAEKEDRILMVGHVLEYHPAVRRLKDLIDSGELGRVRYIYSHRLNMGRIRTEENALWSFAPHDIAIIMRLLEAEPIVIDCTGEAYLTERVADVTLMTLKFPGRIQAHIFVSWLHPFKEHRFVVVGDRQMAVFDDTREWPEKLVLYPHQVHWMKGQIPVAHRAEAHPVSLVPAEPLKLECEHFRICCLNRETPLTDGRSGLRVIEILEAAQAALDGASRSESGDRADPPSKRYWVHPTAVVDDGAEIGEGTRIWHFSHIMSGAVIGKQCILGQNVFVGRGVRIGNGVKIQNNVSVYTGVELEDYVFCGPSMVFTNVINPRSEIERKHEFRSTRVRRGATLGANCTILCGNDIGRYAFVAAGAVVTKPVPDYALVAGVPARIVGWMCACGERLAFDGDTATCPSCHACYRRRDAQSIERVNEDS